MLKVKTLSGKIWLLRAVQISKKRKKRRRGGGKVSSMIV